MNPPLVIVSGTSASGKSTLASVLAEALHLPLVAKDQIKESLARVHGIPPDREASRRLGATAVVAAFEIAAAHVDRGVGIVFECNFKRGLAEAELAPLMARSCAVDVRCETPAEIIAERIRARVSRRHPVHHDLTAMAESDPATWSSDHALDLDIPALVVDTTDGYAPELGAIVAWVEERIGC